MSIEIETVELVEQFLKENNLHETLRKLQEESGVSMNMVENVEEFVSQIMTGTWDAVLKVVVDLKLPKFKLHNLYEQMLYEFVEMDEIGAARTLLRETEVMFELKEKEESRYLKLEEVLSKVVSIKQIYDELSKEKRRLMIANEIAVELNSAPSGRLLFLLNQALKYQNDLGLLPNELQYDLFRGTVTGLANRQDAIPTHSYATIQFEEASHAECAVFSPDGQYLLTGSSDGFIEVWNHLTGKLRTDLKYQAENRLMVMDCGVLCLAFTKDSEYFASGSHSGDIYVWKLQTGLLTKKFEKAHFKGVTSICFSKDSWELLTCGYDNMIKIFGMRSGKLIKEFRGHSSFVNHVSFACDDNSKIISSSSDGTIKMWDYKSGDCLMTLSPKHDNVTMTPPSVYSCQVIPKSNQVFLVCNQSTRLSLLQNGKFIKYFSKQDTDFQCAAVSSLGEYCYAVGADQCLYCFNTESGALINKLPIGKQEVLGIASHPLSNILALFDVSGKVTLWNP